MPKSFYALIVPVDPGAHPEHPIVIPDPKPPVGIWPDPNPPHPAHPIIIPPTEPGKPPVVIWPSPPVDPGYGVPLPPSMWPHPEHPIVLPPVHVMPPIYYPPIIWPQPPDGGPPIIIDPPHPEHPIVLPPLPPADGPHPEHPIVIPLPPEIWPRPGHPAHPIVIPPDPESPPAEERPIDWNVGWTAETGWVVYGIPQVPHPAPGSTRRERRGK